MARINIEDSIFKDSRFIDLCVALRDKDKALGCLLRAWMLAQKWYLTPNKMIPLTEWKKQKLSESIIDTGLAELVGDFVRICGADEQFSWLVQRSNAGKAGGPAAAKARVENIREFPRRKSSKHVGSRPLSLSLTHSLNTIQNTYAQFALSVSVLDEIYKSYPRKEGKARGMANLTKLLKNQSDVDSFRMAVENYAKHCKDSSTPVEYIKHFSTFVGNKTVQPWRDWVNPETQKNSIDWDRVFEGDVK